MLTLEAINDREWGGLTFLRAALEHARRDFDAQLYPTSISDSAFDQLRRVAYLAALIDHHADAVRAAVAAGGDAGERASRVEAARRELENLRRELAGWVGRFEESRQRLEALSREFAAAADARTP